MKTRAGFTLLELLVSTAVIAILAVLMLSALAKMRGIGQSAHCANSLRQLGVATQLYLGEHDRRMFAYSQAVKGGRLWYFGLESSGSLGQHEGSREVDVTQSPLYPYIQQVGGIEICPAFPYGVSIWKPKYHGASWGYGFDTTISNVVATNIPAPSRVILFGDCAQVNTFQSPASPGHPMLEEFYMIESNYRTIHFRHGAHANLLFLDGHIEAMTMCPGTQDDRLPEANVGRITPVGSKDYLY
ncbi:MAG TPA: type II secretion system protein [Chthoniobacteraceae bacterium]|nr:type II secretion system protein [Chthoniobacteraceae bacterium]